MRLALVLAIGCNTAPATPPAATAESPVIEVLALAPSDALPLDVRVIRWACAVTEPTGVVDDNLRVPVGRAIRLTLHSEDPFADLDVEIGTARVHLSRKARAELVVRVNRTGSYGWRCPVQEPPGGHVQTRSSILSMLETEYAAYQALGTADHPKTRDGKIALGKRLVDKKGCTACHSVDGTPRVGVSLAGLWGQRVKLIDGRTRVVDAAFIADSLAKPAEVRRDGFPNAMPSFEGQVTPEQIDALAAYIESLR